MSQEDSHKVVDGKVPSDAVSSAGTSEVVSKGTSKSNNPTDVKQFAKDVMRHLNDCSTMNIDGVKWIRFRSVTNYMAEELVKRER